MGLNDQALLPFIGIAILMTVAVVIDVKTRRIPNWLTVSAFVAGIAYHAFTNGWQGFGFAMAGFGVGFGILLVLWLIGGGGGGDVKLMGAVGAWVGPVCTLLIFLGSAIFAVFCVIVLMVRNRIKGKRNRDFVPAPATTEDVPTNSRTAIKQYIPYAVPVAMASWMVFLFQLIKSSSSN